ncbi:APC family permease [Anaeromicrobium sediminis]|uniref:Amino acid permease n=1 Tax=Anaeromicrobium sediminis TaxID=1478221 RepID=A0A267MFP3_9FIRM|nr:APC family permease [Anaeromicrobium sediminis]PAB57728.1 amino acid permease [Anaeromicrobium sediminis]
MTKSAKLGFWSIVLLGINSIIGTGIFGLPNKAYGMVGEASLWVILFDMFLAVSIALCFAEAAARFKDNGGPYIYAKEAFGNFFGYEVGIMKWFMGIIAWGAFASFFAARLAVVFPILESPVAKTAIILITLFGLAGVNLLGVKTSKIVNNAITLGKLIPLIFFIVVGIAMYGNLEPVTSSATPIVPTSGDFVDAAILLFFAFTGFESIAIAAEDMENPMKNLPKAIIMVMALVSLVYIAILAICMKALGPELANSATPVADAAGKLIGSAGKILVMTGTLISVAGINIAASFVTPKSGVALAQKGMLPEIFMKTNKNGAPYAAILVSVIVAAGLALTGQFATLAAIGVIVRFIQYIPTCISVLIFRHRYPDQEISFKIPFGPIIPIIATVASIYLLVRTGIDRPDKIIWGLGGLFVIAPFYYFIKDKISTESCIKKSA